MEVTVKRSNIFHWNHRRGKKKDLNMAKNIPKLMTDALPQIQETQQTLSPINKIYA